MFVSADIGGTLGLYLGATVLTVLELFVSIFKQKLLKPDLENERKRKKKTKRKRGRVTRLELP